MKFSMDETMKHRVIGITVIISIAAVFLPAMLKKSSQRMDEREIAIHLPPKPEQLSSTRVDEEQVFQSVKVAHVDIPTVDSQRTNDEYDSAVKIGKPESLHVDEGFDEESTSVASHTQIMPIEIKPASRKDENIKAAAKKAPIKPVAPSTAVKKVAAKSAAKKSVIMKSAAHKNTQATHTAGQSNHHYAVQMGVFTEDDNAQSLLKKLLSKGFSGEKIQVQNGSKTVYKVTVGNTGDRKKIESLKKLLLSQTQIKGFIVEKGVG